MASKHRQGTQERKTQNTEPDKSLSTPVSGNRKEMGATRYRSQQEDVPGEGGLDEPTAESQRHSRGAKGARGSNH